MRFDTNDWLFVHPDDAYGPEQEGELGKTECWYIIDAEEGAEIIYGSRLLRQRKSWHP